MKKKFKIIFPILVCVCFIVIAFIIIFSVRKNIKDKTVKVAFYGLSQDLCQAIPQEFVDDEKIIIQYDFLADGNLDLGTITKKYDMIFAWNGEVTQNLSKSAEKIIVKAITMKQTQTSIGKIILNFFFIF